jgi:hypothetical protein
VEELYPWINTDIYVSPTDHQISVKVSPSTDDLGTFYFSFIYYELGTPEQTVLTYHGEVTITPDTAEDASISEEFGAQADLYQQNLQLGVIDQSFSAYIKEVSHGGQVTIQFST